MNLESRLSDAIKWFWKTRSNQSKRQGLNQGVRDHGNRTAVTGGKQLNGFVRLVTELLAEGGLPLGSVHVRKSEVVLPGYFRPSKEWDLVVVHNGKLLATVEFKSQVGSLGNNFNNRIEEALGNATDIQRAYREGAFKPSPAPWLGYLMMLERSDDSTRTRSIRERHFPVMEDFKSTSYADRYGLFCQRLVRERLYNAACFIMSDEQTGIAGSYLEPMNELNFKNFAASLIGHVSGYVRRDFL
ncbi:MAG: restriction endonuclease [Gammaproteobacteria bacterium]|nr:restriction endonuclease [Gammaproteobacteria bacterium]MDE0252937.1 restriction endonuclease [Gammaproteobacteria bacterium]MDE0402050.1 restriction endonuclease [Gammaproteobacteria bacterium]